MRSVDALEPEDRPVDLAELGFFTPSGQQVSYPARFDGKGPVGPGGLSRTVTAAHGWTLVQHLVPVQGRTAAAAREALEREIGAAVAISRRVGDGPLAACFLPFAGYDLDAPEPFVLYEPPRGEPVERLAGRLNPDEVERLLVGLVVAVRVLEAAGVVHRDISPGTVRWDGRQVQLDRPARADMAGRRRVSTGSAPYAAPEQLDGVGRADPRDDLWSVAQVGYFVHTGRPATGGGPPPDLRAIPALAQPLGQLFAPAAAGRPDPVAVLRLLSRPDPLPPDPVGDPLTAGRAAFDRALQTKRQLTGGPARPAAAPAAPARPRSWLRSRTRSTED